VADVGDAVDHHDLAGAGAIEIPDLAKTHPCAHACSPAWMQSRALGLHPGKPVSALAYDLGKVRLDAQGGAPLAAAACHATSWRSPASPLGHFIRAADLLRAGRGGNACCRCNERPELDVDVPLSLP